MFCGNCGKELTPGAAFCPYCGAQTPPEAGAYTQAQQPYGAYPQGYYVPQGVSLKEVDNANTLGLVSLIGSFFIPLLGVICGAIGLSKIKNLKPRANTEQQQKLAKSKKLCLAGVIISVTLMVISIVASVIWGIYISRRLVNEFENIPNDNFDYHYEYGEDFDDIEDFFDQYGIDFD